MLSPSVADVARSPTSVVSLEYEHRDATCGLAERRGKYGLSSIAVPDHLVGSKWRSRIGRVLLAQNAFRSPLLRLRMARHRSTAAVSAVITEVESDETAKALPLWKQGSEALYTSEALQARGACRHDKAVLAALNVWWQTAQRSLQSGGDVSACTLCKTHYVAMMKKIYKVMIEEYDDDEATACAEEDWQLDLQGYSTLDRGRFCDAIFQLADVRPEHEPGPVTAYSHSITHSPSPPPTAV